MEQLIFLYWLRLLQLKDKTLYIVENMGLWLEALHETCAGQVDRSVK